MIAQKTAAAQAAYSKGTLVGQGGVFSLDQLHALGQTGDVATDWAKSGVTFNTKDPTGILAGGGRGIIPTDLPAGNYNVPGIDGAYYFDPKSGQAPQEFIDWVNKPGGIERDPFTHIPTAYIPMEGGPEALNAGRADQSAENIATQTAIFALGKGADGTYQDAQDRVLGLGKYQQFMLDANGKQVRVPGTAAPVTERSATFTDVSPDKTGAFDRLAGELGKTAGELAAMLGVNPGDTTPGVDNENFIGEYYRDPATGQYGMWMKANDVNGPQTAAEHYQNLRDSMAANYERNALGQQGLKEERISRGEDPTTGQSATEARQIYDTLKRIGDPEEANAYLMGQDPGNLTADELTKYNEIKAPELAAATDAKFDTVSTSHFFQGQYVPGEVSVTSGNKVFKDAGTGRSTFVSGVPYKIDYKAPVETGGTFLGMKMSADTTKRITGGIADFAIGFATGGSGWAALAAGGAGAYIGAGGALPNTRDISFRSLKGLTEWNSGPPQALDEGLGMQIMMAVAFAAVSKGISSVKARYFPAPAFIGPINPAPAFWIGGGGSFTKAAVSAGMQGVSAAKSRQSAEDFMNKAQRQSTSS